MHDVVLQPDAVEPVAGGEPGNPEPGPTQPPPPIEDPTQPPSPAGDPAIVDPTTPPETPVVAMAGSSSARAG